MTLTYLFTGEAAEYVANIKTEEAIMLPYNVSKDDKVRCRGTAFSGMRPRIVKQSYEGCCRLTFPYCASTSSTMSYSRTIRSPTDELNSNETFQGLELGVVPSKRWFRKLECDLFEVTTIFGAIVGSKTISTR